jgi:hypothetical protein
MEEQNTPQQGLETSSNKPRTKKPALIILLVVLFLISAATAGYIFHQNTQLKKEITELKLRIDQGSATSFQTTPSTEIETGNSEQAQEPYTENTSIPGQKKYVSPELGISFLYMSELEFGPEMKEEFVVTETGNKIFLHAKDSDKDSGKYVEVFEKEPQKSLEQALVDKFNLSEKCAVETNPNTPKLPETYTQALIRYQGEEFDDLGEAIETIYEHCPEPYTPVNWVAHFIASTDRPDKMAFIAVGQACHNADNNSDLCWYETIRFIEE